MEFQLEQLEQKNPAKKKERVCVFFCKEPGSQPSEISPIKIIDRRQRKRKQDDISEKNEEEPEYMPTDRKRILERLELTDVTEELKTQSVGQIVTETEIQDLVSNRKRENLQKSIDSVGENESDEEKEIQDLDEEVDADEEKTMDKFDAELPEMVEMPTEITELNTKKPAKKMVLKIKPKKKDESEETIDTNPKKLNLNSVKIGDKIVASRLPPAKKYAVRVSSYYMNNRKLYIQKLAQMFKPYRDEILRKTDTITCDSLRELKVDFDLLTHQKVVRDYLNLFTPYRGVLLYHSLGSGKSCSSIAIAEGMKSAKKIILMTPASLKMNFFNELKKCGDPLYRKNQFWEFVSTEGKPDTVHVLAQTLGLTDKYVKEHRGAWVVDISKPSNAAQLSSADQDSLNEQIDVMIRMKYYDINYNGMNRRKLRDMTQGGKINPFDHSVVVIDEAHNFVSRICNKLKQKTSISYQLYNYLMDATDVRVVLVSGTPIINYPNEIGVLFNILRGYIKTWIFHLQTTTTKKINTEFLLDIFHKNGLNTADYVQYSGNVLTVTRNPYGFVNIYNQDNIGKKGGSKNATNKNENKQNENKQNKTKTKKREPIKPTKQNGKTRKNKNKNDSVGNSEDVFEIENGILVRKSIKEIPLTYEETLEYAHEQEDDLHKGGQLSVGGANKFEDYVGVKLDETGNISDEDFQQEIIRILAKEGIRVMIPEAQEMKKAAKEEKMAKAAALEDDDDDVNDNAKMVDVKQIKMIPPTKYKCLPDTSKEFLDTFVDTNTGVMINSDMFKRRILGLASYYRSSQEQLMPSFVMTDHNESYHKVVIDMSEYQFDYYYKVRKEERDKDKNKKKNKKNAVKDAIGTEISSTYRIFSRSACNFAFPNEYPRPMPDKVDFTENDLNAVTKKMRSLADDYIEDDEGLDEEAELKAAKEDEDNVGEDEGDEPTRNYLQRIEDTLEQLRYDPLHPKPNEFLTKEGLEIYSPKFLSILENIQDKENEGLHMLYSQFRTVEGIGLFQLVLEAAGFAHLKIKKTGDSWELDELPEDADKPKFVLYTGTETKEEKEVLLNIYNSTWDYIPPEMAAKLRERHENNHRGEIVKLLMITSSGAEGINLRNTRFVHIMEPYWNNVRIEQVIGRARRICSHQDLPEEMRTVKVFMYLMRFTEQQKKDDKNIEIMIHDISRIDGKTAITTDEALVETAQIKQRLNSQILKAIKESAMDCNVYTGTNKEENLVCYGYGTVRSNQFGTYPNLEMDKGEKIEQNVQVKKWQARKITDPETGIDYALNQTTGDVYDLDSYTAAKDTGQMILVGKFVRFQAFTESGKPEIAYRIDYLR